MDDYAMLTRNLLDVDVREAAAKVGDKMHTLLGSLNGHIGTDTTREFCYQKIALIAIQQAHATDVRRKIALAHKLSDEHLMKGGRLPIHQITGANESLNQRRWRDYVAHSQAGEENLVERPHIDHPLVLIETFQ